MTHSWIQDSVFQEEVQNQFHECQDHNQELQVQDKDQRSKIQDQGSNIYDQDSNVQDCRNCVSKINKMLKFYMIFAWNINKIPAF